MSIRIKVILPYLLLTLLVAITGAYVVTRLVTNSLSERLKNQLLEAGRVVSDDFARQELQHIENARVIIFTRGVAEALRDENRNTLDELVTPTAGGIGIENLYIVDLQGRELLHILRQADGGLADATKPSRELALEFTQAMLARNHPDTPPSRAIHKDPEDNRWYYFTAVPFVANDEMVGAIILGNADRSDYAVAQEHLAG